MLSARPRGWGCMGWALLLLFYCLFYCFFLSLFEYLSLKSQKLLFVIQWGKILSSGGWWVPNMTKSALFLFPYDLLSCFDRTGTVLTLVLTIKASRSLWSESRVLLFRVSPPPNHHTGNTSSCSYPIYLLGYIVNALTRKNMTVAHPSIQPSEAIPALILYCGWRLQELGLSGLSLNQTRSAAGVNITFASNEQRPAHAGLWQTVAFCQISERCPWRLRGEKCLTLFYWSFPKWGLWSVSSPPSLCTHAVYSSLVPHTLICSISYWHGDFERKIRWCLRGWHNIRPRGHILMLCMYSPDRCNKLNNSLGVRFTSEHKNKPCGESDNQLGHWLHLVDGRRI